MQLMAANFAGALKSSLNGDRATCASNAAGPGAGTDALEKSA